MKFDADKLVATYIRIRDEKDRLVNEHEARICELTQQLTTIEQELLDLCKESGQDGGKTAHGTFTRTVKTRYWTTNWPRMYQFVREHNALELFEQRIHQGNMKQFLTENPGVLPEGLTVDSRYAVTVRRASK